MEPPSFERLSVVVWPPPVAGEHIGAPGQDLTGYPVEAYLHAGERDAHRPGSPFPVVGVGHQHEGLGGAVALQDVDAGLGG